MAHPTDYTGRLGQGVLKLLSHEELLAIGGLDGVSPVLKFGSNPAVGTSEEDVWNLGGEETLLTSGAAMFASCADNTNGVGQSIRVEGLDSNWAEQVGFVTLTGQTAAAIVSSTGAAQTWTRIHRAYQVSASPDPTGDVYIAESDTVSGGVPQTGTKIHALIDYTDAAQQTEKALFTVPADHIALVYSAEAFMSAATGSARSVIMGLEVSELAVGATVASPSWTPRRSADTWSVSTAMPIANRQYRYPKVFGELTNIHLRAKATTESVIAGSFQMLLLPVADL